MCETNGCRLQTWKEGRRPFEIKDKGIFKLKGLGCVLRKFVIPFSTAWYLGIPSLCSPVRTGPLAPISAAGQLHVSMCKSPTQLQAPSFSLDWKKSRKDSSTSLIDLFILLSRFLTLVHGFSSLQTECCLFFLLINNTVC